MACGANDTGLSCAMLLDLGGFHNLVLGEELPHGVALVALELEDLAHLLVLDDGAVAALGLLDGLEDLLEVELAVEALHGGDALAPVALLHANVHQASGAAVEFVGGICLLLWLLLLLFLLRCRVYLPLHIRKRIDGSQVAKVHALGSERGVGGAVLGSKSSG